MPSPPAASEPHPSLIASQRLARNWWAVLIRGIAAVAFGVVAILMPGLTIFVLLLFFAGYVLVDGVFTIFAALNAASEHHRYGLLLFEGILNLALAAVIVISPFSAFLALIYITAAWALLTGAFMLVGGIRLSPNHGRWWFVVGGLASMIWGVLLGIAPYLGALVFTWWFAAYAIVFGFVLIILAIKLRSQHVERWTGEAAASR